MSVLVVAQECFAQPRARIERGPRIAGTPCRPLRQMVIHRGSFLSRVVKNVSAGLRFFEEERNGGDVAIRNVAVLEKVMASMVEL